MSIPFRISAALWDKIHHFASFPQTGVSLQQMVLFGQVPSQGTLFKASQFLAEELPIRLAHRVRELDQLPYNLHDMPSINKVKHWYAQSFEVRTTTSTSPSCDENWTTSLSFALALLQNAVLLCSYCNCWCKPMQNSGRSFRSCSCACSDAAQELVNATPPPLPDNVRRALTEPYPASVALPEAIPNPSLDAVHNSGITSNGTGDRSKRRIPMHRRYYVNPQENVDWPPEVREYNASFTRLLERIKRRHDPTVITVAQGVNEWKRSHNTRQISVELQDWLDRFYMSRIGIRFLIGQRTSRASARSI